MRSFSLKRHACPCCNSEEEVSLARFPLSLARAVLAAISPFLISDIIPLRWRCGKTRAEFRAHSWE